MSGVALKSRQLSVRWLLLPLLLVALLLPTDPSGASTTAPGPPLQEPVAKLAAALKCSPGIDNPSKTPVLLVHGTGATPHENWSWNYAKILPREGYPVCTVQVPHRQLGDIQMNVEYVVFAIRRMAKRSGRKVSVIGHSQGSLLPIYALRFWPDLVSKVDDFVGFAGVYTHGTEGAKVTCLAPCPPAVHQLKPGSNFLTAISKKPLPPGPSYTGYSTGTDTVVTPQPRASRLEAPGVRNYVLQTICPFELADHTLIVGEKLFVQLTLDALAHRGPAVRKRIGKPRCGFIPETATVGPIAVTFAAGTATTSAATATPMEPPLRDYLK